MYECLMHLCSVLYSGLSVSLQSFSADSKNQEFCLAHLFTAIAFSSGTLGLSYVASPSGSYPGGLCSRRKK